MFLDISILGATVGTRDLSFHRRLVPVLDVCRKHLPVLHCIEWYRDEPGRPCTDRALVLRLERDIEDV